MNSIVPTCLAVVLSLMCHSARAAAASIPGVMWQPQSGGPTALIHDNGPFLTHPGQGAGGADVSAVQDVAPINHTILGWNTTGSPLRRFDEFVVCDPQGWLLEEVELWVYQIGSGTQASPFTVLRVEVLDGPPDAGGTLVAGSPTLATNLMTAGTVIANQWSGVYRTFTTSMSDTQRPLMNLRVALPAPVTLPPGTYWIGFVASGGFALSWTPAVTVVDKAATGNSVSWTGAQSLPTLSNGDSQGMPFRLYGTRADVLGSFDQTSPGCSAVGLDVEGAPVLGGFLHAEITNGTPGAIPLVGVGLSPAALPVCVCIAGHDYAVLQAGSQYELDIPTVGALCGLEVYVQGVEFFAGGCSVLPLELTPTVRATIR